MAPRETAPLSRSWCLRERRPVQLAAATDLEQLSANCFGWNPASPRVLEKCGFVKEGGVLLRIDPRDYETNLLRARAALESAESTLSQERGRAEVPTT